MVIGAEELSELFFSVRRGLLLMEERVEAVRGRKKNVFKFFLQVLALSLSLSRARAPGLIQVAERGADDLLDFSLVDVDAGAEGGGFSESVGDEMGSSSMAISSRRRRRAAGKDAAAAAAVSAAAARDRGAHAAARKKRACC